MTTTTEWEYGQALGPATHQAECEQCGIRFAIPKPFYLAKRSDHTTFYCPNGHPLAYCEGKSKEQVLREQLEREQQRGDRWRDKAESEQRSHAATKGHLTRTEKRVGNGACPCCNRHFKNLERHMQGQHPDYSDGEA